MKYQIESKDGMIYGTYEGDTPEAAWEAMVRDAGGPAVDVEDHVVEGTPDDWVIVSVED